MSRVCSLLPLVCATAGLGLLAAPTSASADDHVLAPISMGAIAGPRLLGSTLGAGIGGVDEGRGIELLGRAVLGPGVQLGMGGVRGSYAFVDKDSVHFGVALAATFGGGRYRGQRSNLLAAAEPGLFVRLLMSKAGAVELGAAWYQPVWVPRGGIRGGAMATISWHPMFEKD